MLKKFGPNIKKYRCIRNKQPRFEKVKSIQEILLYF